MVNKAHVLQVPLDGSMADTLCLAAVSGVKCMKWFAVKFKKQSGGLRMRRYTVQKLMTHLDTLCFHIF